MKRYGQVIRVKPEKVKEYRELHAAAWPGVLDTIRECNIRNYSIFLRDQFLFAYFEYHGTDFESDMRKMAEDPATQKWWELTSPCQEPVETHRSGEWWADMEELFHTD